MASPDINTEDFMAAVDFLYVQDNIDTDKIGIIGICGWGGMAINAAALDTRVKATVASTMYDMTRVNVNGYFDSEDSEEARFAFFYSRFYDCHRFLKIFENEKRAGNH